MIGNEIARSKMKMSNQKSWERQQFEKEEIKKYCVVNYSRKSEEYREDVVVIPIEIEVPTEIDSLRSSKY